MANTKQLPALHIIFASLLLIGVLTACGGGTSTPEAIEPEIEPPPKGPADEIDQDLPEGVFFWGFDAGSPPGWEHSPEWQFEQGNALSEGPGQSMFSAEQWANFNLFSRIQTGPDTAFGVFIRATEEARYQIIFEPGAFVFFWQIGDAMDEVVVPGFNLEPGWHEVHIYADGAFVSVAVDGEVMFEKEDLEYTSPGSIGFLHHSDDAFSIDFIEVHRLDGGREEITSPEEQVPESTFPPVLEPVLRDPPIASLIEIGDPNQEFRVTLTGSPGAVEPGSLVSVANLATSRVDFTDALEDGSFQMDVFAFPGTSLQVKHADMDFFNEQVQ